MASADLKAGKADGAGGPLLHAGAAAAAQCPGAPSHPCPAPKTLAGHTGLDSSSTGIAPGIGNPLMPSYFTADGGVRLRALGEALASERAGWDTAPSVATLLTGLCLQLALPAFCTSDDTVNCWVLGTLWVGFEVLRFQLRGFRSVLLNQLQQRAQRRDGRLSVSADMAFSLPEYQIAFERWTGHGSMDWMPNMLALFGQLGVHVQMAWTRASICSSWVQQSQVGLGAVYLGRLLFWRYLSLSQRSWLVMTSVTLFGMYINIMLYLGDVCYLSLFAELSSAALPGALFMEFLLAMMFYTVQPVMVRHMPAFCLLGTGIMVVTVHLKSELHASDPYLATAAAQQQVAAMILFGGLMAEVAFTIRCGLAKRTMSMFLSFLDSHQSS